MVEISAEYGGVTGSHNLISQTYYRLSFIDVLLTSHRLSQITLGSLLSLVYALLLNMIFSIYNIYN